MGVNTTQQIEQLRGVLYGVREPLPGHSPRARVRPRVDPMSELGRRFTQSSYSMLEKDVAAVRLGQKEEVPRVLLPVAC